jgi:hypothetical protein
VNFREEVDRKLATVGYYKIQDSLEEAGLGCFSQRPELSNKAYRQAEIRAVCASCE